MSNLHENIMSDLDNWINMYDAALKRGVFDNAPKPAVPSSQTADVSFFGPFDTHPTDDVADVDAAYWQQLHERMSGEKIIREASKPDKGEVAKGIAASPNPIHPGSVGMDQDIHDPDSLSHTYNTAEIEELSNLKTQLYELECKLNALEAEGKSFRSVESKMSNLKVRINDLSDEMGR